MRRRYDEKHVDRRDLQELARVRLKEATALLSLGLFDGAYYPAGYAVECGLKACIAKEPCGTSFRTSGGWIPATRTTCVSWLELTGLSDELAGRVGKDPGFKLNWEVVQEWSEQSRYQKHRPEAAQQMLEGVGNRSHGVISWIKLHW